MRNFLQKVIKHNTNKQKKKDKYHKLVQKAYILLYMSIFQETRDQISNKLEFNVNLVKKKYQGEYKTKKITMGDEARQATVNSKTIKRDYKIVTIRSL